MGKNLVAAEPFTLEDLVSGRLIEGDLEIINECNETLITLAYVEDNVCTLDKTLSRELLDRQVLKHGVRDGRMMIKIEGVEDAD